MKPEITSKKIFSILSIQWLNFKEIVNIMGIDDSLDRRYLQLKLKELSRKGKVEYVYYMNDKYWRNINTQSKEIEQREFKNSESNLPIHKLNFEKEDKLSFCSECGALMLPSKVNDTIIMKCKCGATKPFDENQINMYILKTNIDHHFDEDSIFYCVCGKKFESQVAFLDHSKACQEHKKYIVPVRTKHKRVIYDEFYEENEDIMDSLEWYKMVKNDEKVKISREYYCVYCGEKFQTGASYLEHRKAIKNNEIRDLFQRGIKYRKLGEYQKAVDCFKKILTINPHICDAILYLKLLESI